jgi:hypothetical protein
MRINYVCCPITLLLLGVPLQRARIYSITWRLRHDVMVLVVGQYIWLKNVDHSRLSLSCSMCCRWFYHGTDALPSEVGQTGKGGDDQEGRWDEDKPPLE